MKLRRFALALAFGSVLVASPGAHAVIMGGAFCDQPQSIVGFGTPSQYRAHYEIFIPEYQARCSKANGLISYFQGADTTTIDRMIDRGPTQDSYDLFWALDQPLSPDQSAQIISDYRSERARVSPIGQFPIYAQGLSIAYNLSCTNSPVKFRSSVLSLIYLGQITTWDDPRLVADNPELSRCVQKSIKLTARVDITGQSVVFKQYLARRNPEWAPFTQAQFNKMWPATISCYGLGDAGEAGCVAANTGSIGYVQIPLAQSMGLKVGQIERVHAVVSDATRAGVDFVTPSLTGCTQAAAALVLPPGFDNYSDWSQISIVDEPDGYPICYFTYMFVFQKMLGAYAQKVSVGQAQTIRDYLKVIFDNQVQGSLPARGYASIPADIITMDRQGADAIQWPDCIFPTAPVFDQQTCTIHIPGTAGG